MFEVFHGCPLMFPTSKVWEKYGKVDNTTKLMINRWLMTYDSTMVSCTFVGWERRHMTFGWKMPIQRANLDMQKPKALRISSWSSFMAKFCSVKVNNFVATRYCILILATIYIYVYVYCVNMFNLPWFTHFHWFQATKVYPFLAPGIRFPAVDPASLASKLGQWFPRSCPGFCQTLGDMMGLWWGYDGLDKLKGRDVSQNSNQVE